MDFTGGTFVGVYFAEAIRGRYKAIDAVKKGLGDKHD
jgi:hypothetical protein